MFATGTVPFTTQTASSAITSKSARGSPPRNASKTRRIPSSAFKRCEREAVAFELRVIELGELPVTGPDDCLARVVDRVREGHPLRVVDPGDGLRERERDAFERVVVVVAHDHAPRVAGSGAGPGACALLRWRDGG